MYSVAPTLPFSNVLIYSGHWVRTTIGRKVVTKLKGPYTESVTKQTELFDKLNRDYQMGWKIHPVYGDQLISFLTTSDLTKTLLVLPAGQSSALESVFSKKQIEMIKSSVKAGLSVFATCGSAYWICKERRWDDRLKQSSLGLIKAKAFGPLAPYKQNDDTCIFRHEAIDVIHNTIKATLLLSGGGTIIFPNKLKKGIKVVATYDQNELNRLGRDHKWENAVVKCQIGAGIVMASMIHPAYGASDIEIEFLQKMFPEREDNWGEIRHKLSDQQTRLSLVYSLLQEIQSRH